MEITFIFIGQKELLGQKRLHYAANKTVSLRAAAQTAC